MNYSAIKFDDTANGDGIRVAFWVSGCRNHCKGCFNPETWNFEYGQPFTHETIDEIIKGCDKPYIDGVTILGGEPFEVENQEAISEFIFQFTKYFSDDFACKCRKTIWIYTGYKFGDLTDGGSQHTMYTDSILFAADVMVVGPFVESLKDLSLKFRGSSNQNIMVKKDGTFHVTEA